MLEFLLVMGVVRQSQPQVIGSLQPIRAAPGDDIILPCHVEPPINVSGLTVEWSRPDLKPDPNDRLSRVDYVHLYRDRREVTDIKIASYVGRTLLSTEGLGKGDISLKIYNVRLKTRGDSDASSRKQNSPTTETPLQPRYLQTPDPKEETANKGVSSRSNVIPVVVFSCLSVFLLMGF
ncbi:hypothetical protein F7725_004889 [Dissostichus mawsoni]|uniref:Ig-like domain-containing protein n=1 Tax=Dissostichus mawsoni TaxID=36200 RepID=A0A7J5XK18_DISMA|nr:hypothetical protein F7725_004889 [Dissostichus mawsoni]